MTKPKTRSMDERQRNRNTRRVCGHVQCTWLQRQLHLDLHTRILPDGRFLPVDIRHSHCSCSRLLCVSSLRRRRGYFWVSYSLTSVPASTRWVAFLVRRRMNSCCTFGATRNNVSIGFFPGVAWAKLSLPVSFDTDLHSGVLSTVLRSFCTCYSERRFLAEAPGSALTAAGVRGVLRKQ